MSSKRFAPSRHKKRRPQPLIFDRRVPLADGLKAVLRARVERVAENMDGPIGRDDDETLHRLRVSLRRLHALLKLYRQWFPRKTRKIHNKELRRLLRMTGRVRENDLFVATAEEFNSTVPSSRRMALELLIVRKIRQRAEAKEVLRSELTELKKQRFVSQLRRFIADPLSEQYGSFIEQTSGMVDRLRARFLILQEEAMRSPVQPEKLHALRIAGKPLRYLMETIEESSGKAFRQMLRELVHTLGVLGAIHDCDIAIAILTEYRRELAIVRARAGKRGTPLTAKPVGVLIAGQKSMRDRLLRQLSRSLRTE